MNEPLDADCTLYQVQRHSGHKLAELEEPVRLHFSLRQNRLYSFQIVAREGAA